MEELIAKRYIGALKEVLSNEELENVCELFDLLASNFSNEKFKEIIDNSEIAEEKKLQFLLDIVKPCQSEKVNNFIRLIVSHKRLSIIPWMSCELNKELSKIKNTYKGTLYSAQEFDESTLAGIKAGLDKKTGANIELTYVKNDYDGIRAEVSELGLEIDFSKSRLEHQLVDHILKAI